MLIGYPEKNGFCSADPGSLNTGVRLYTTFELSLKLATEITLGPGLEQNDKNNELWVSLMISRKVSLMLIKSKGIHANLEDICFPISVPGLGPA